TGSLHLLCPSPACVGRCRRRMGAFLHRSSHNPRMANCVVGLTGGVASGKTEAGRRFEALGITVADADVAARDAVAVGSAGLAEVVASFGDGVLDDDGALDRAAMRRWIYADPDARRCLEAIIHPRVRNALRA